MASDTISNPSEKIPGTISIRLIKRHNNESKNKQTFGPTFLENKQADSLKNFKNIETLSHSEWYTISEKHIERIINDSDGFRIVFSHPLPKEISSWSMMNLHSNCRFELSEDNTLLWLDDPKKNFRCFKCKVLYEEGQNESNSEDNADPITLNFESKLSEFNAIGIEKLLDLKDWISLPNIPISNVSQYQIKSPTLLLLVLSFSSIFNWTTPLICISIISLGLCFQEK